MRRMITAVIGITYPALAMAQIEEPRALKADTAHQDIHYMLQTGAILTTNDQVPFWMRANQYGSIPIDGFSGTLTGSISKDYKQDGKKHLVDWAAGVEARINIGKSSNFNLIEGYLKGKLSIFQLKAGRTRDINGLVDPDLSTGAFAISGNALGIPKIELSIPEYWNVPLTRGFLAIKGNFAHGWTGSTPLNFEHQGFRIQSVSTYYHQKSIYARIGKPSWKVKLYGGFNHEVMWGGEDKMYGKSWEISKAETFFHVVTGQVYGNKKVPYSKIGNHIGSIDQAISIDLKSVYITAYHQFFYEVGGLYHLNNLKDGLFGLSIFNKNETTTTLGWKKIVVEFLNSKSQGGELDAKITPSGDEDYYNNFIYASGWTYKGENLGNPLLTNRNYARKELPSKATEVVANNRVTALHLGMDGYCYNWTVKALLTYSINYGTYGTSPIGGSLGPNRFPGPPPYFEKVNQFSGYLEAGHTLGDGFNIGFALALDQGQLLYNSFGGMIKLSKNF
jgi:hypothetical protein